MEVLLLGPLEVRAAGRLVPLGGPRQRSVLAALTADVGAAVPAEALIDRVWGQDPPPRARHALHAYITRLRRLLPSETEDAPRVVRRSGGYALDLEPRRVDLWRFRHLVARSRERTCADRDRVTLLTEALDLWRGAPLGDLRTDWAARVRETWQQQYLEAVVTWAQTCLRLDGAEAVTGRLTDLVAAHPTVEPLVATLMRALQATGRSAEALERYDRVRRLLRAELGTEPGPELRRAYDALIAADAPDGSLARPAPRQLPAPPRLFTGRVDELAELDRGGGDPTTALTVISGMAGVGKTALALHWAHRVADRFPDGQLYVNLRGFDASGTPTAPATAIRRFLDALHVPPQRVPVDLDAQQALYRTMLAGRRLLLVLDNARDADQVRPLLPGAPGCLTVVTSRHRLAGLVATEAAHPLFLDVLSPADARDLLARRLGADRIATDPDAADKIVAHCARLPLALAIAAARAATQATLALSSLAAALGDANRRLDALDTGDAAADVRAVFSWSYQQISPSAARLFRLVGLHPGPDISVAAATSMAGAAAPRTAALLAELTQAHMLTETPAGRSSCHDLLRTYATDLADADEQALAIRRLLDHYLHTAYRAARVRHPTRRRFVPEEAVPGVVPEELADTEQALAWLTTEHQVLLAAVELASSTGHDRHAYQLAWCLNDFLDWRGHWSDWEANQRIAIAAARRLGDPIAQALAHRGMAGSHVRRGGYDAAYRHLRDALALLEEAGAVAERAEVHLNIAVVRGRAGAPADALDHALKCLRLSRVAGSQATEGHALETVAWAYLLLGEHRKAVTYCRRSLTHARLHGNREAAAASWDTLGQAHQHLGNHAEARTCHENALALCRALGNRYFEARALERLGDAHDAIGEPDAARQHWLWALAIFDELGNPEAAQVRAKLQPVGT